jgi:type II secretion system protein J
MKRKRTGQSQARLGKGVSCSAFTLIEVMLALAVSAIVLAAIGSVFYSAMRLRDRTSALLDQTAPLQHALTLLRRDLQGALPPGPGNLPLAGDFQSEAMGGGIAQNDRLTFFTTTGALRDNLPWGDIQQVSYELRDPTQGASGAGRDLIRSVTRNVLAPTPADPDDQWLMGNVQSLEVSCFDGVNWRDSWDTGMGDTNLPTAIRIRIQLANENGNVSINQQPIEMLVPLLSQSRTNQPTTTTSTTGS